MDNAFSLAGKKGLVLGLANANSIAFGCASALSAAGAELICAYGHPKAEPHVTPLMDELNDAELQYCDVRDEQTLDHLFDRAVDRWGKIDFLIHSIAFARAADLQGRLTDSSLDGFLEAMDISCHSFVRLARRAEPLMPDGGALLCMSYLGADRVVRKYGLMGPVKAALQSCTKYLASELGPAGIRVHALSPGPLPTRAASGIQDFGQLEERAANKAALGRLATLEEVANLCAFLVSDAASGMTGDTHFVDGGSHLID